MEKKDIHLENFKQALVSTIKSISEIGDCNISFGEQIKKQSPTSPEHAGHPGKQGRAD